MEVRKSLVVNSTPLETRIALLENGQLCELFLERTMNKSQVGDIYKGRVAKLLPGFSFAARMRSSRRCATCADLPRWVLAAATAKRITICFSTNSSRARGDNENR